MILYLAGYIVGNKYCVKVGITDREVKTRLSQLQMPVQYEDVWHTNTGNEVIARELEKLILDYFEVKRGNGEWLLFDDISFPKSLFDYMLALEKISYIYSDEYKGLRFIRIQRESK